MMYWIYILCGIIDIREEADYVTRCNGRTVEPSYGRGYAETAYIHHFRR